MADTNIPQVNNQELEQCIAAFKEEQSKENLVEVLKRAEKATVFQPVTLREKDGRKVPEPIVIKNPQGQTFFAAFTSVAHFSDDMKKAQQPMIMIPFAEVAKIAGAPTSKLDGIVFNPFTDNVILHPKAIELVVDSLKAQGNAKTVNMTPEQLHQLILNQSVRTVIADKFFADKNDFFDLLNAQKGQVLCDLIQTYYEKTKGFEDKFDYEEEDFEIMVLNISDDTRMARVGLPEKHRGKGTASGVFFFLNTETEEGIVYITSKGDAGQSGLLHSMDITRKITDCGEAPEEGSELYALLDKLPWK